MHIELFGTDINWVAQLIDFIGFIIIVIAYQQKKMPFLVISMFAYACFVIEPLVLLLADGINTWANIIVSFVAIVRNLFMILYLKKWNKELPVWIAIVILVITWAANIPFLDQWYTYLPCTFLTIYTFSAIQKNYYILKTGAILNEGSYVVYNFVVTAYIGAIREIVLCLSIVVSMIILAVKQKKEKTQLAKNDETASAQN